MSRIARRAGSVLRLQRLLAPSKISDQIVPLTTKQPTIHKSGRPQFEEGADTVLVTLRMTPTQREMLEKLGDLTWMHERIDKAKLPKE